MNSLERQKRLTKLLAMVQTVQLASWAVFDEVKPEHDDPISRELGDVSASLRKSALVLIEAMRREIAGR